MLTEFFRFNIITITKITIFLFLKFLKYLVPRLPPNVRKNLKHRCLRFPSLSCVDVYGTTLPNVKTNVNKPQKCTKEKNLKYFKIMFHYVRKCIRPNSLAQLCRQISDDRKCEVIRRISSDDVSNFARLTGDTNPIHFEGEEPIVHGALLIGIVSGIIGTK